MSAKKVWRRLTDGSKVWSIAIWDGEERMIIPCVDEQMAESMLNAFRNFTLVTVWH